MSPPQVPSLHAGDGGLFLGATGGLLANGTEAGGLVGRRGSFGANVSRTQSHILAPAIFHITRSVWSETFPCAKAVHKDKEREK